MTHPKNPVIRKSLITSGTAEGWTIRYYRNGLLDAVKGVALTPGFNTLDELCAFLEAETGSTNVAGSLEEIECEGHPSDDGITVYCDGTCRV